VNPLRSIVLTGLAALVLSGAATATETLAEGETETKKEEKKCTAYSFKLSGYFKADYAYDDLRTWPGNFAIKVSDDAVGSATHLTARETRLGFDFAWADDDWRTAAKLEFDFYGLGAAPASVVAVENKSVPMLRHAYLSLSKGGWAILAGQTSDVISPLVPATVNYTVGWGQGNIGYRRPQFRVTGTATMGSNKLIAAVAAARTIAHDIDVTCVDEECETGDGYDDGSAAGFPTVQGRLGFEGGFGGRGHASLGVSGHYGKEKSRIKTYEGGGLTEDTTLELDSWSVNADLKLKLTDKVSISGEFFMGQNLGSYFGGVLQDYSPTFVELGAMGGWGMLTLAPFQKTVFNFGYCFDDPDDADFVIPDDSSHSMINMNSVLFGNVMYGITNNVTAMIEASFLKTTYLYRSMSGGLVDETERDFDGIRVQFALKAAIM
jgi:hypothetical protein